MLFVRLPVITAVSDQLSSLSATAKEMCFTPHSALCFWPGSTI
ncbi:hypothetical protein CSB69_1142 [Morganella morganii]|nr:hypothetical protein CSB69_1142 [Morganella morganii]